MLCPTQVYPGSTISIGPDGNTYQLLRFSWVNITSTTPLQFLVNGSAFNFSLAQTALPIPFYPVSPTGRLNPRTPETCFMHT